MAIAKPTKRKPAPPEARKFAAFLHDRHQTKFKTMIEGDRFGPEDHRTRLKTEMAELLVIQTEFKRIFKLK
jgi:hypothetical protein